jgi:hypothetical protein
MQLSKYDHREQKNFCRHLYRQIKKCCENPKSKLYQYYGKMGITCQFTSALELEWVYRRDRVDLMREPYLGRLKPKCPFSRKNCLFIERKMSLKEFLDRY